MTDCSSQVTVFDLHAVICHHGTAGGKWMGFFVSYAWTCRIELHYTSTFKIEFDLPVLFLTGGHYTAYCLNYLNDQWYEFDDQYVTEVEVGQVINCEAYVLFYRYARFNPAFICTKRVYFKLFRHRYITAGINFPKMYLSFTKKLKIKPFWILKLSDVPYSSFIFLKFI